MTLFLVIMNHLSVGLFKYSLRGFFWEKKIAIKCSINCTVSPLIEMVGW